MFRGLAGYEQVGEKPATKAAASKPKASKAAKAKPAPAKNEETGQAPSVTLNAQGSDSKRDMALTVRIEINLPANGSKETYDNIFKSIRANLINE